MKATLKQTLLLTAFFTCATLHTRAQDGLDSIRAAWTPLKAALQHRCELAKNMAAIYVKLVKKKNTTPKQVKEQADGLHGAAASLEVGSAEDISKLVEANTQLTGFLARLLVEAEQHAILKASKNWLNNLTELEDAEHRMFACRKAYNTACKAAEQTSLAFETPPTPNIKPTHLP